MVAGHIGLGIFVIGITLTSAYSIEKDIRMDTADSIEVAGYTFTFNGVKHVDGPNYSAEEGMVSVTRDGKVVAQLDPQKRVYNSGQPMTEASIDAGLMRDLYVALGEKVGDQGAWAVRIYHKPLIRWIWLGALIMAFGGFLAAVDPRYRRLAIKDAKKYAAENEAADAAAKAEKEKAIASAPPAKPASDTAST